MSSRKAQLSSGSTGNNRIYDLGPFRLDVAKRTLSQSRIPVRLGLHAVEVLTALVERAPDFVPKATIMDAAWRNVIVEESNLTTQIYAIRRVFAQVPGGDRWIETLARRGYRYAGPVSEVAPNEASSEVSEQSNLPTAQTSFVGRERELRDVKRLLSRNRFLTISGIGGIGKTRLALQLASEVLDAYRHGVRLVELGAIRDGALLATVVAQRVGVSEKPGKPVLESLRAFFRTGELLLILDNCEHLVDAVANFVGAALDDSATLCIVATSREALRIPGEQIYALESLSLPAVRSDMDAARDSDAVQLFVDRVRQQVPDFELTAARLAPVVELCIGLDGIPLALELAAARARSLSVEQLRERLSDRFRLLTAGARNVIRRQQTLRATLDWSYDLLTEAERVALRRLSIFPGRFMLEAALAVVSDAEIDEFAAVDVLSQLVTRSLVNSASGETGAHYRLLETTRAYAYDKLAEIGETQGVARRHAEYFGGLFERAADDWLRVPDVQWHALYIPLVDDVRAALEWALGSTGDAAVAIALAGASGPLWTTLSLYGEGARWLEAAAARINANTSELDQARLFLWLGLLLRGRSPSRGLNAFERAVDLFRKLDRPLEFGYASARLARALAVMRRFEESKAVLAEARPKLANCAFPKILAFYHGSAATLNALTDDPEAARTHFHTALTLFREAGSETAALESISNLADISWNLGDLAAAEASLREYIAMRGAPFVRPTGLAVARGNLAGILTEQGRLSEALEAATEATPGLLEVGLAWSLMDHFALRAALAGQLDNAARLAGFADGAHAAEQAVRAPNETRARRRLQSLLEERLDEEQRRRLIGEGQLMTIEEAAELALRK